MCAGIAGGNANFNPHSHKGSDVYMNADYINTGISIHTPTRGVTNNGLCDGFYAVFQSTLPQGE